MEPEEGKYAWLYNENYKKLIKGALDRGLKLCFRVYDNGQDNIRPATPHFIRNAGAKGYFVNGVGKQHWTAYPDDLVFKDKWTNFVKALAKEYDNPEMVDFVDGYSIGAWGEAHTIKLLNESKLSETLNWFTTLYNESFKRVLLLLPMNSQVGFQMEKEIAIKKNGYNYRRDGLGSMWFTPKEKQMAKSIYGKVLLVGESCYWGCSNDDCKPFESDKVYSLKNWKEVYELTYKDAINYHFNTLDLREIPETKGWTEKAPHLVKNFIEKGGYRFFPIEISLPETVNVNDNTIIVHSWVNKGTGYLPNNNIKWNYKYKPAVAILNDKGEAVKVWIDDNAEPSTWLNPKEIYKYNLPIKIPNLPKGKYSWAIAIIDKTENNKPGLKLAIKDGKLQSKWNILAHFMIKK
jgi:hypothetical protein